MQIQINPFIKSFVDNNYDIIFQGDGVSEDFQNVEEFLLADNHGSRGYSIINCLFINLFSKSTDVAMIEAVPSLKKITRNDAYQSVYLETLATLIGWDIGTCETMFAEFAFAKLSGFNYEVEILIRDYFDPTHENKEEIKAKLIEALKKIIPLFKVYSEEAEDFMTKLLETFPLRIETMQQSLMKAKETYPGALIFLIAGNYHLIRSEKNRFSTLESFYSFLKTRKVVVLSPKAEIVKDIDEGYFEFYREVYAKAGLNI